MHPHKVVETLDKACYPCCTGSRREEDYIGGKVDASAPMGVGIIENERENEADYG